MSNLIGNSSYFCNYFCNSNFITNCFKNVDNYCLSLIDCEYSSSLIAFSVSYQKKFNAILTYPFALSSILLLWVYALLF